MLEEIMKKPVSALPYDLDYITEELRRRAKAELFEDEDTIESSLRLLREKLKEEKDLHCQDDDSFLLSFLRARKYDVKRALSLIRNFYTVMGKHDELYMNLDMDHVMSTLEGNVVGFLPYRDEEGCVVLIICADNWDPNKSSLADIMRALTCGLVNAIMSPSTQVAGFKVIVDFKGFSFHHLPHVQPTYLWLLAEALQNCFPGRFRAVHVVNEGHLFTYVWTVLKQMLTKKLKERFHFHGRNLKKLHRYFHPSILPAEYDGELPPFDNSEWAAKVEKTSSEIHKVFSYGYEKYRNRMKNN